MTNLQMEHLVERWEDRRDVKNQMGKFVHYLLLTGCRFSHVVAERHLPALIA